MNQVTKYFEALAQQSVNEPQIGAGIFSHLCEPPDLVMHELVSECGYSGVLQTFARISSDFQIELKANQQPQFPPELLKRVACYLPNQSINPQLAIRALFRMIPRLPAIQPTRILRRFLDTGGVFLHPEHDRWPRGLADLGHEQPFALWCKGQIPQGAPIALVGARACSRYGEIVTDELASELAQSGAVIYSGGAYGIDEYAHRGALAAEGKTVAIMAGGVDRFYPECLSPLHEKITQNGAVISELPPSARPARWRFLARNRLIAALGMVTVVVEAGKRSGALSTARRAMEIGRPVGAVPGPLTSHMSVGTNRLLKDGAQVITSAEDIVDLASGDNLFFGSERISFSVPDPAGGVPELTSAQRRVLAALPLRGLGSSVTVANACGLSLPETLAIMGELASKGLVFHAGGGNYRKL